MHRRSLFLVPALWLLMVPSSSSAVAITYEATDLADLVVGEDLWEYAYSVADFDLSAGHGFSILFDPALFTALEDPPPAVSGDWDVISIQPDLALPDAGRYDAQALADAPDLSPVFTVTFVFLAGGEPGAQFFEIYDPGFSTIETGFSVSVPEPGLLVLVALVLATTRPRGISGGGAKRGR